MEPRKPSYEELLHEVENLKNQLDQKEQIDVERLKQRSKDIEQRFESIVNSSPAAMYFYQLKENNRLVLTGANPSADKILGIANQELIGKTIEEAFPNLAQTEIPDIYRKVARKEIERYSFEIPYNDERFGGYYSVDVFNTKKNEIAVDFVDITDRKSLENSLKNRVIHLSSILKASESLSKSVELNEILQIIAKSLTNLVGVGSSAIYLLYNDKLLLGATTPPLPDEFPEFMRWADLADHPTIKRVIQSQAEIVIPDSRKATLSEAERATCDIRGLRSILYLPLRGKSGVLGVTITASTENTYDFTDDQVIFAKSFANHAAIAIENAKLYKSLQDELDERKIIQEKFSQNQILLSQTEAIAHLGSWMLELSSNQLTWTDEVYRIFGFEPREFEPNYEIFLNLVHPDDREEVNKIYANSLREGKDSYEIEHRIIQNRTGEVRYVHEKCLHYRDSNGKVLRSIGMVQDITVRKKQENALLESRERFKSIIRVSNTGAWEYNAKLDFLWCSPEYFSMLGYHSEQFVMEGKSNLEETWINLLHPDDKNEAAKKFRDYLDGGSVGMYESYFRMKHANGEWIWIWSRGQTLMDTQGNVSEITIGTHIDITQQKKSEIAIRESEEKLQALFSSMTEMVALHELVFDKEGNPADYRITDCNDAYTKNLGIKKENAIGKLGSKVYEQSKPPYFKEFSSVALTGKPYHFETYYAPMDKHFSISVVSPGKNKFATVTTDITAIKQIQQIIAAKNKELEQIVYVASHDLRSPLVNVDGYGRELEFSLNVLKKLLHKNITSVDEVQNGLETEMHEMVEALKHIRTSTKQMDSLLKGLLKLSRSGRASLSICPLDMNLLVNQVCTTFDFQLKEYGIHLHVNELPSCRGDAVQVTQVFSNLIDNAIKYRNPNSNCKIHISGKVEFDKAIYVVEDNGIGIAQNHLENIFELFHRLNPKENEGEGLGLTIVRQILSRLDGEIKVESNLGSGSKFFVSLPYVALK